MRIGERSGFIALFTRGLTPLFTKLMPEIPANHPALGAMVMNISANALGLDNAATPLGIKNIRHALTCGIIADCAGIISAIFIAYWFFA